MKIRTLVYMLVLALSFGLLTACEFNGGVEQGRCVSFDEKGKSLTIVVDVNQDRFNPDYKGSAMSFKLPEASNDMGPAPEVGGCLMLNVDAKQILIFDQDSKSVKTIDVDFTDVEKGIKSNHPKVKGKTFPMIDKEKGVITIYSDRQGILATFKIPAGMQNAPAYVWTPGSEMRIAFRKENKGQAIRIMNVSKTDIFKK